MSLLIELVRMHARMHVCMLTSRLHKSSRILSQIPAFAKVLVVYGELNIHGPAISLQK